MKELVNKYIDEIATRTLDPTEAYDELLTVFGNIPETENHLIDLLSIIRNNFDRIINNVNKHSNRGGIVAFTLTVDKCDE